MRFINNTEYKAIDAAIADAEKLLNYNSPMMRAIRMRDDFKYGAGLGVVVANELFHARNPMVIETYSPWNPWTKAIGSYSGGILKYNIRKLPYLSHKEIVGNLLHEWAHHCGFHHGNNFKTKEKCLYSVPYFISSSIGKWL